MKIKDEYLYRNKLTGKQKAEMDRLQKSTKSNPTDWDSVAAKVKIQLPLIKRIMPKHIVKSTAELPTLKPPSAKILKRYRNEH